MSGPDRSHAGGDGPAAALVDLDGTVHRSGEPLPGAREGLAALRAAGVDIVFLTNDPTRTPAAYAERLVDAGVEADPTRVLTPMAVTVAYLEATHPDAAVLPVAGDAVVDQLRASSVELVDYPAAADVVVAGFDPGFDYAALTRGLRAVRAGAALVGTDPDRWVPTAEGPIPGSGAIVGAVAAAAECEPEAVLGKPSRRTAEHAMERVGVPAERCLLVGDRLDTDVAMGARAGMRTALVLTGVATREDLAGADVRPDHVVESLADVGTVLDDW